MVPVMTPAELMLFAKLHSSPPPTSNGGSARTSSSRSTQRAARYSPFTITLPAITPDSLMSTANAPSPRSGSSMRSPFDQRTAMP